MDVRPWTEADELRLRHLVSMGVPYAEIASRLGRSRGAVGVHASKLGLKFPRVSPGKGEGWSESDLERLRVLAAAGASHAAIASALGRTVNVVRHVIAHLGIAKRKPPQHRWAPEEDARARALLEGGLPLSAAAREMGVTLRSLKGRLRILRDRAGAPPAPAPARWEGERLEELRRLALAKLPTAAIAAALGCSRDVVCAQRRKLGIAPYREWDPRDDAELRRIHAEHGWGWRKAAVAALGRKEWEVMARARILARRDADNGKDDNIDNNNHE